MKHKPGAVPARKPRKSKGSKRGGDHTKRLWFRVYRQRIVDGLETCRNCGVADDPRNWLTFDHIRPHSRGHRLTFENATILCEDCNAHKADRCWGHLVSLAEEEARADPLRRWFALAHVAAVRSNPADVVTGQLPDSDITIMWSDWYGLRCLGCGLVESDDHLIADTADGQAHLDQHRAVGDLVPAWVDDDLRAALSTRAVPTQRPAQEAS